MSLANGPSKGNGALRKNLSELAETRAAMEKEIGSALASAAAVARQVDDTIAGTLHWSVLPNADFFRTRSKSAVLVGQDCGILAIFAWPHDLCLAESEKLRLTVFPSRWFPLLSFARRHYQASEASTLCSRHRAFRVRARPSKA